MLRPKSDFNTGFRLNYIETNRHFNRPSILPDQYTSRHSYVPQTIWDSSNVIGRKIYFLDTSPKQWKINSLWLVNLKDGGQWSARIETFWSIKESWRTVQLLCLFLRDSGTVLWVWGFVMPGPGTCPNHLRMQVLLIT